MNIFSVFADIYTRYVNPALDILLLTILIYWVYQMIIRTNAGLVFRAVTVFAIIYGAVVFVLKLPLLTWLLNIVSPALLVGFAIVLQPEIRKLFLKLGQQTDCFFSTQNVRHTYVDAVLVAATELSRQKRGMLVVFLRKEKFDIIKNSIDFPAAQKIDANLSASLLITIFGHDTPMHDGACIVEHDKIIASGCMLPLSEQNDIKKTLGTRHRAALGMSEKTDAVVLVVSEETGSISLAYDGILHYDLSEEQLPRILEKLLNVNKNEKNVEDAINEHKTNS